MHGHKNRTNSNQKSLALSYKSKEDFIRQYKDFDKTSAREFYLQVLVELQKSISEGNQNVLKKLSILIENIGDIESQISLRDYFNNVSNPIKYTNLVILACKHNKVEILKFVLMNSKLLFNLSTNVGNATIAPIDQDEYCHNAFYYAIRFSNAELLDTLINKWPDDYFATHAEELDKVLSRTYEELKLKNILLSQEIEVYVEKILINLRFFSNDTEQMQSAQDNLNNIRERVDLVLENIDVLMADYSNEKKVDEKFLLIAKFIAQNIHILKRQLKSTYDRLPWEEVEFCLVSFVSAHTKRQEMNLFYHATLNKSKILNHLENFARKLRDEKFTMEGVDILTFATLPKFKREKVIAEIISNNPQFEELYSDFQQISDIYSLEKISCFIGLVLSTEPKTSEGQLITARVLQVIGEYLKNTLESPKLSNTTSELLLLSLPKNARKIVIDLRNSISHSYSLSQRIQIMKNADVNFFINIQNDIKKIGDIISDILYNNKIKTIRILLKRIVNSESIDEIKEVTEIFSHVELDKIITKNLKMIEHQKLQKLMRELNGYITDKTNYEKELFDKINNIINCARNRSENFVSDYITGAAILESLNFLWKDLQTDLSGIKFRADQTLKIISPKIESQCLKNIAESLMELRDSAMFKIPHYNLDKVNRIFCEIFYIAEFEIGNIKWIEALREKLSRKGSFIPSYKNAKTFNITKEIYNNQLSLNLSELKRILSCQLIEKFPSYKSDKKMQAVVEMLVLDIMSILCSSKQNLENNQFFLDNDTPLLTGKCLRNHLAHGNALIDVMLNDPSIAVILNAKKLISENVLESKKKLGKLVRNDPSKLRDKYEQSLAIVTNQEKLFIALEEGNLESSKDSLNKGADINARSINFWTALHFAAKGPSLEVIQFLVDQKLSLNVKDNNGQSPLHIAGLFGRKDTVKFLVNEAGLYVDDIDDVGKTTLHIAAQNGYKATVEVLLQNNANTAVHDKSGYSPLHYAISNNHVDIAKILLTKDSNVDINESVGGFTPLHGAAEFGYMELVNFLIQNEADVNARNDRDWTPLHAAALNGHLEVVTALIQKGANVNAKVVNGCTPLHYAAENGHKMITSILLKHGANVNAADKTYNNTPLHYGAKEGYEEIVNTLLENKANVSIATIKGSSPLHLAAQRGHLKIVIGLLEHGVDIHAKDKNNATPLHYAVESGRTEIAELLVKNGAEISNRTNRNLTLLHVAALNGHKDISIFLIKNKAGVNVQDIQGETPLHAAAMNGSKDVIKYLIKNGAEVNARTINGMTPLHFSALCGHGNAIDLLIKNDAKVSAIANNGFTPLHAAVAKGHKDIVNLLIKNEADTKSATLLNLAIEAGHKEIVEILAKNGADVNIKSNNLTPLISAIRCNQREIVKILITNGANVNADGGESLFVAALAGYRDIVDILLKNNARVDIKGPENSTPLHLAASRGHKGIVKSLITKGANVGALTISNTTPLYIAAQEGHEEVVELLVENGANVNVVNTDGAPLHIAAGKGNNEVVEVLLKNGAKINDKDKMNRTAVELAAAKGHLQVVKTLLQYKGIDINAKGNDGYTALHIAAQEGKLEIVKYLLKQGSDIHATNNSGSKPIHIATREGYKDTIEFLISKGSSVNELGAANQTLLHYASMKGQFEVVKYLIAQGADVNIKDTNDSSPMHIAAQFGYKDVIEVLLKNGAVYNSVDKLNRTPLGMANDNDYTDVINLLASTDKLFEAVKRNGSSELKNNSKAGAFVNAKDVEGTAPLHYAAWKGYDEVVNILLQNNANANIVNSEGFTPLHYAAKFSHLKVVKTLLFHGAIYNSVANNGKTPLNFTKDKSINSLFKLVSESFQNVKDGNSQVINGLNNINDIDTVKAIMSARNSENKTLVVAAIHNNFPKVEQLKEILQGDISKQLGIASALLNQGNYKKALIIFESAFERRKEILGLDNPGTLDIQTCIAKVLYAQGIYQEALNMFEEIFQKQKEMLGLNHKDTLGTRSLIAFMLHTQGKEEEALNIYQEVYQSQKETLGTNHSDSLDTWFHMALVLDRLENYEEALDINRAVFKKRENILGANDPSTIRAQNNIAMVLGNQGKNEEALKVYEEVLKRKKAILGNNHSDTLRTLHNIAGVLFKQKKFPEALKAHQEVLDIRKNVLGLFHPDTLHTQYNMGNIFFAQGKHITALKTYRECFDQIKAVFGLRHPVVLDISEKMKRISLVFKIEGYKESEILQHLQKEINISASNGDIQTLRELIKNGADLNDKDIDGRTSLHYAVSKKQLGVVNILIKAGADVTLVTNKGNTTLHTAASMGYKEMAEVLLQHVNRDKLNDFVNAKTAASGTTALHVAAQNGYLEIVLSLLKNGAIYDIKNREGKTPLDNCNNQNITALLNLAEELLTDAQHGDVNMISKLKILKLDEFLALTNARNTCGNTLLQVAIANKHKNVVCKLLEMLKNPDQHF